MRIIDTKGLTCPRPLIMLKEALTETDAGEEITVITDNETSLKNLITYLKDQGAEPDVTSGDGVHTIVAERPDQLPGQTDPSKNCDTSFISNDYVVSIKSELMGEGDPELGRMLMETFLDHLKLQEQLPSHVLMYNSGVKLAIKGTPTCMSLNELEELGCRIMLCGTCIDYYAIQYEIGVGMISDMVTITETMRATGHVVNP